MTQSATKRPRNNPLATPSFCGPANNNSSASRTCFSRRSSNLGFVRVITQLLFASGAHNSSSARRKRSLCSFARRWSCALSGGGFRLYKIDITYRPGRFTAEPGFYLHPDLNIIAFQTDQPREEQRVHSVKFD